MPAWMSLKEHGAIRGGLAAVYSDPLSDGSHDPQLKLQHNREFFYLVFWILLWSADVFRTISCVFGLSSCITFLHPIFVSAVVDRFLWRVV